MSRTRRFVVAAVTVTTAAVLVSPAGAATTAWTSARLTQVAKGLTRYMTADNSRDRRQQLQLKSVGHVNFIQGQKLHSLSAFTATAGGRLSALEARDLIQAQLNGGILDLEKCVQLPVGSPGAPHGGWLFVTRSGDSYIVYNGGPGPRGEKGDTGATGQDGSPGPQGPKGDKGDQGNTGAPGQDGNNGSDGAPGQTGLPGSDGAPGLSAYQVWLAEGNAGTVGDFMKSITGPRGDTGQTGDKGDKGDTGQTGAPGQNGKDGSNGVDGAVGAPGLTAYQEWLAAGNSGSIADFLHSIVGPKGDKGDTGAPGTDGSNGAAGAPGQSAFQAWLALGNTGTVSDFVHSLIGPKGDTGDTGPQGAKGDKGATGPQGPQGVPGIPNATLTTLCVKQHGGGSYYLTTSCNGVSDTFQVYVAN